MHRQLLILLSFVPFIHSCFTTNRCQCDRVQYIDQAGIQKLEYGSYLANRTTTRPNVTVTDSCQILVDVSKLDTDNHYLMVFRDGAPPIFAKHLSNSTDKLIELTDISCVKIGETYEWEYYNGEVNSLAVTVQSNEHLCECKTIGHTPEWTSITVDPAQCDHFSISCTDKNHTFLVTGGIRVYELSRSPNNTAVVEDMTCVSGQWYYNSVAINPNFLCTSRLLQFHCGCMPFEQLGIEMLGVYTLDLKGRFANYTLRNATLTYDESQCTAEIKCFGDSYLVIFSANYEPMIYPPGTKPNIMCAYTPLKSSSTSQKYWFIDGIMLSNPYFGCYENKCPCSFAYLSELNNPYFIGSHPLFNNISAISSGVFYSVYQKVMNGHCPDILDCKWMKLTILDTQTAVEFPEDELVNVSCSATTKNWTANGMQFDQLYVNCF